MTGDRELLDMTIDHERSYWRHLVDGAGLGEAWFDPMEQAIARLPLLGGTSSAREAKVAIGPYTTPARHVVPSQGSNFSTYFVVSIVEAVD